MPISSYKDLNVWKQSMDLVTDIYKLIKSLPNEEKYGLRSQMQRCATSIPSNIAEGSRRSTTKDYLKYIYIAFGSGSELETQLEICKRLEIGNINHINHCEYQLTNVVKMLNGLSLSLKNKL